MTMGIRLLALANCLHFGKIGANSSLPLNQGAARYIKKKVAPDATHLVFVRLNKGDVS